MRYAVVFEKSDHSFGAYVPDLPGCIAVGKSLAEAKSAIAEAMRKHLETMKAEGRSIPQPASVCAYIDA